MTEFVGILVAWWREGGILSFIIPLALALIFALLTTSTQAQSQRAIYAVISLLSLLLVPILLPSSRPFATLDWIVVSISYIGIALTLALSHVKQVKNSLKQFFKQFDTPNERHVLGEDWLVAEGSSSFKVLIFGIYGLAALLGSITCYLYIGVSRGPEGFIFQNNEGFVAALSLLIIVLAGAAVPIYTDLAKQVRTEIDLYESQISSLQQASTNAGHHADFLWTHFERVARYTIREWSSGIDKQSIAQANHLLLFMPFLALREERKQDPTIRTIENVRDEVFTHYLHEEPEQTGYRPEGQAQINFERRMPGADQHYFTAVGTEASLNRVLLFLYKGSDLEESGRMPIERDLSLLDRRHRARRLKYLGWSLQDNLAIAQAREGVQDVLRCGQDEAGQPIVLEPEDFLRELQIEPINSWEFRNYAMYLVPATEELFVAFLQQSFQTEYDTSSAGQTTPTLIHLAQLEFNRRAQRHLHQWSALDNTSESASLSQDLATCGDPLDFDVSTLSDDMALFHHLFIATKPGMNQGADARFLYYCFWLIALQNASTRVSQIVGADRYDGMEPRELLQMLLVDFKKRFSREYLHEMDTEEEFLLLSLADHKSALYNWLRAAKAVTTRKKLQEYEARLDRVKFKRQLGIEVLPRMGARISHLRHYLDVNESQKPLTVRSVFDLLPVASAHLRRSLRERRIFQASYHGGYRRVVEFLDISNAFKTSVGIDRTVALRVINIRSRHQWIQNNDAELSDRTRRFLEWIISVFEDRIGRDFPGDFLQPLDNQPNYKRIIKALWCVSPAYRNEVRQFDTPADQRTELTDREMNDVMQEILNTVRVYCLDQANAETLQACFFGLRDRATEREAPESYERWLERFRAATNDEARRQG